MTAGPFTPEGARTFLGGRPYILLPFGARFEPGKDRPRSIQDGSAPGANASVQKHCTTRIPPPGIQDSRQIVAFGKRDNIPMAMVQLDYGKAHRRIPIL